MDPLVREDGGLSFREEAITFIRQRAAQAAEAQQRDFEIVGLAAYLFAIACQLQLNHGNARLLLRDDDIFAWLSEEELFEQLASLSADLDSDLLFSTLISALLTIENVLREEPAYSQALPRSTPLEGFPDGSFRGLGGHVLHWLRPPSALSEERASRFREFEGGPPDPAPDPGTYLERLALYWDSDPRLPGVVVPTKPEERPVELFFWSGKDLKEKKAFRVALCPLPGRFHPKFHIDPADGRHFQALKEDSIAGRQELHDHLSALVEAASAQHVNLLVLPELSVDTSALAHLQGLLKAGLREGQRSLYGVVAGSFHVWGRERADEPLPVNETVLLDPAGEIISRHWKKGRFRITPAQVKHAPHFYDGVPDKMAREIFEEVHYGFELRVLDTSLGRIVVLICADAIAADDRGYLPVVRHLHPDLLIVVSMTPETQPFEAFAEEMRSHWIGTLFVNAHCVCARPEPRGSMRRARSRILQAVRDRLGLRSTLPNLVACDLALYEPKGSPPSRLRWRYGKADAECIYHRPADHNRNWRPLSQALGETGVSWLARGTERLGMVVNLGVHSEPWAEQIGKSK